MKIKIVLFILLATLLSCSSGEKTEVSGDNFHESMQQLTDVIVHDIFSPPVASRNYVYPSIAAYECVAAFNADYESLAATIKSLKPLQTTTAKETVDYQLAALHAFNLVAEQLVFSTDSITNYKAQLKKTFQTGRKGTEYNSSIAYGEEVADHIITWMKEDNYHQTRSFPKFSVNFDDSTRWQPTPPDYMEGIEPHWNKIRTMVIDSAQQFKPTPPPAFSLDEGTDFHNELMEVYEVRNSMTDDESEEVAIARFWDCNPYVSTHKGHFMFATKKITPGGHWMGITKIASLQAEADFDKTVWAYTKTSIALFDAFISCWDEKYRSALIRPETLINQHMDDSWKPILQTPPFPEYTSGHSVISAAAAEALTSIFGNDFAFDDTTEVEYGLPVRSFTSFYHAKNEAAISRLYGGIHYRAAIDNGVKQGEEIGKFVVQELDGVSKLRASN